MEYPSDLYGKHTTQLAKEIKRGKKKEDEGKGLREREEVRWNMGEGS